MKINTVIFVIISLGVQFLKVDQAYCQTNSNDSLFNVVVTIVAEDTAYKHPNQKRFYTTISVTNTQDTIIKLWLMDHSWVYNNFEINNDSIFIISPGWDVEGETQLSILPHSTLKFCTSMMAKKGLKEKLFQVAFLYFNDRYDLYSHCQDKLKDFKKRKRDAVGLRKYWSKLTNLQPKLNTFEVE